MKKLHGQKALLERDINKRESLAGRRRDSVVDRTSNVFDPKRAKGLPSSFDQTLQVIKKCNSLGIYKCPFTLNLLHVGGESGDEMQKQSFVRMSLPKL